MFTKQKKKLTIKCFSKSMPGMTFDAVMVLKSSSSNSLEQFTIDHAPSDFSMDGLLKSYQKSVIKFMVDNFIPCHLLPYNLCMRTKMVSKKRLVIENSNRSRFIGFIYELRFIVTISSAQRTCNVANANKQQSSLRTSISHHLSPESHIGLQMDIRCPDQLTDSDVDAFATGLVKAVVQVSGFD